MSGSELDRIREPARRRRPLRMRSTGFAVRMQRLGPVQGFAIPTLKRCGLLAERVAGRYHEILMANFGSGSVGDDVGGVPPLSAGSAG